jgi:hypothetical protein
MHVRASSHAPSHINHRTNAVAATSLPAANSVPNRSETILKNAGAENDVQLSNQNGASKINYNHDRSMENPKMLRKSFKKHVGKTNTKLGEEERQTKTKKASPEGLSLTNSAGLMHNY